MPTQVERATVFNALHTPGNPVVLFNAWDAGSAGVVARAGAKAIATGSWSVAAAHGYADGELLPLNLALATLREIVAAVDLPVTIDLESGYGRSSDAVADTFAKALANGAIGANLEDQVIGSDRLYAAAEQSARLRAARRAADSAAVPAFINARTDLFLKADPATHDDALLEAALQRAASYAQAGASGFFAPGLIDERLIGRLCDACTLPVNILARPGAPSAKRLAELGVARISHGPGPYRLAMRVIEEAAREAMSGVEH
jgi:2-methylisocitrate lyase-like PEP mutase family enzyme